MAIGSTPEIGTTFKNGNVREWLDHEARVWRLMVGDDGLGGYATLAFPPGRDENVQRQEVGRKNPDVG